MARLFLVRHGEPGAAWGGANDDPGLSERGLAQAQETAVRLRAQGALAAISSPMRRCLETAAPFAPAPRVEPRISEVAAPAGVSDRRAWLQQNFPWQGGAPERRWQDAAAALLEWRAHVLAAVRELQSDTVAFTHFIAINVIVGAALQSNATIVCKPGYASLTELLVEGGDLKLVQMGAAMNEGGVH